MVKSIGKCSACGNDEAKLTPIKIATGSFYGELRAIDKKVCYECLNTEFFYVDNNGTVKFNTIKTEVKATINEDNK